MSPPVAAMMQEMMTIGVIFASNSTPDGADTENPPPGIFAPESSNTREKWRRDKQRENHTKSQVGLEMESSKTVRVYIESGWRN
jgi:hypothetical protein